MDSLKGLLVLATLPKVGLFVPYLVGPESGRLEKVRR